MNTEARMLRYHFSPEEHLANCAEMARLLGASDEMELTNKQIKTGLKEAEEAMGAELARHGRFVRDGYDHRKTECRWDMDIPGVGQKTLVRIDSGDVVEVRRMEDHEKQGTLFEGGKRVDMSPEEGICKACQADIPLKEGAASLHVDEQPCKAHKFVTPAEPVAASPEPSLAGATAGERKKARREEEAKKKALREQGASSEAEDEAGEAS